jgi:hypothetical protein
MYRSPATVAAKRSFTRYLAAPDGLYPPDDTVAAGLEDATAGVSATSNRKSSSRSRPLRSASTAGLAEAGRSRRRSSGCRPSPSPGRVVQDERVSTCGEYPPGIVDIALVTTDHDRQRAGRHPRCRRRRVRR